MADTVTSSEPASAGLQLLKLWYLLGALMLLSVAAVSLMPVPPSVGAGDKLSHAVTYFVLGGWFALLASGRRVLVWSGIGLLVFGMLLELLQGLTGYRYSEWGDVLANGGGILTGALLYFTPLTRVLALIDRKLARFLLR